MEKSIVIIDSTNFEYKRFKYLEDKDGDGSI